MSTVASRQHNFVTRAQLLGLGLSRRAITARLHAGKLTAVHAGVYALGAVPRDPVSRGHAAVLACGVGAALSHDSAAALWELRRWPRMPEVTAPTDKRRPGIRTHRSRTVARDDVTTHFGVRVTTIARTIDDISPRLTDRQLMRAVNDARLSGHLGPTALHALIAGHSRAARLLDPDQAPTRSTLEDEFARWLQRHRLPTPRRNAMLDGREVDALFERQRVIVELDGWRFHNDRRAFEADRDRDAAHAAADHVTVRITRNRLTSAEADRLRRILANRS